jgi:hypothetical protein
VRLRENFKVGLLEKLCLAEHVYGECHRGSWDEARILEIESDCRKSKYKVSAHMTCLTSPIRQRSLDIFPICIAHMSDEVTKSKRSSWHYGLSIACLFLSRQIALVVGTCFVCVYCYTLLLGTWFVGQICGISFHLHLWPSSTLCMFHHSFRHIIRTRRHPPKMQQTSHNNRNPRKPRSSKHYSKRRKQTT